MQKTIVFIYNAHSDIWNKYIDFAHKIISPSTYACDLCSLTHGNYSEKKIWKEFRNAIPYNVVFMYKNEFLRNHQEIEYKKFGFPVILEKTENKFTVLMNAEELHLVDSTESLIRKLQKKLV